MSSQRKEENVEEMDYIDVEEMEYIVVEKILQKRVTHEGKLEYFIKWKSLPDSENVWMPVEVLGCPELGCPELINAYEDSLKCESSNRKRKLCDTKYISTRYILKKKAHVEKSNDAQMNINSLPQEVVIEIFRYLSHNQLGRIALVCKKWHELIRCPSLWRKVAVCFQKPESENKEVAVFLENLPSSVTHLKLDFQDRYRKKCLDFEKFCVTLGKKCPSLKVLFLRNACSSVNLQSAIDLCRQYIQSLEVLSFRFCNFSDQSIQGEYWGFSKIKVLDLQVNYGVGFFNKISFSKMSNLRKLVLFASGENDSWFEGDISFLENLEVLNLQGAVNINSRTFRLLQNHAFKLTEIHLCDTRVSDFDFRFSSSMFPQLKTICLKRTRVICQGVVHLIQSCKSLQNVYVNNEVAVSCTWHPYFVLNRCQLDVLKTTEICYRHKRPVSSEINFF